MPGIRHLEGSGALHIPYKPANMPDPEAMAKIAAQLRDAVYGCQSARLRHADIQATLIGPRGNTQSL